jgi:hypothetical protein
VFEARDSCPPFLAASVLALTAAFCLLVSKSVSLLLKAGLSVILDTKLASDGVNGIPIEISEVSVKDATSSSSSPFFENVLESKSGRS